MCYLLAIFSISVLWTWEKAVNARNIFSDSKYLGKFIVFSHAPDLSKKKKRKKNKRKFSLHSKKIAKKNKCYVDKYQCSRITTSPRCFQRHVLEAMVKSREICRQKCERSLGRGVKIVHSLLKKRQECRNFPKLQLPNCALLRARPSSEVILGSWCLSSAIVPFVGASAGGLEACGSIKRMVFRREMRRSLPLLQCQTNFILSVL